MLTPEWLSAISTFILVLATSVYVFFTIRLASETKKLREIETTPFISLQIELFRNSNHLQLTIENIGKSPAYNIEFTINEEYKELFRFNFDNKISYFVPNQKIECFSQKTYNDFLKLDSQSIPITVKYFSKDKLKIIDKFELEWLYLNGTLLGVEPHNNIVKSIDNISNKLNRLISIKENS